MAKRDLIEEALLLTTGEERRIWISSLSPSERDEFARVAKGVLDGVAKAMQPLLESMTRSLISLTIALSSVDWEGVKNALDVEPENSTLSRR